MGALPGALAPGSRIVALEDLLPALACLRRGLGTMLAHADAVTEATTREDEALGETTIESKSTTKKRTMGLELRSRTRLGPNIYELVACRGLNEAWNASVDVVAHEAPAKVHMLRTVLEVPVLKHCDVASQESTVMSSASLVERARIGARTDFHEKGCAKT